MIANPRWSLEPMRSCLPLDLMDHFDSLTRQRQVLPNSDEPTGLAGGFHLFMDAKGQTRCSKSFLALFQAINSRPI